MAKVMEMRRGLQRLGDNPRVRRAVTIRDALARKSPDIGEDSTIELRNWRKNR